MSGTLGNVEASRTSRQRAAAGALVLLGALTVVLSFSQWASCPTTPCGGFLQAISEYSGVDLGFGWLTALAGGALVFVGVMAIRSGDFARWGTPGVVASLLILAAVVASIVWMYAIPGDDKAYHWPPATAALIGTVGLITLGTSLYLRRPLRPT